MERKGKGGNIYVCVYVVCVRASSGFLPIYVILFLSYFVFDHYIGTPVQSVRFLMLCVFEVMCLVYIY